MVLQLLDYLLVSTIKRNDSSNKQPCCTLFHATISIEIFDGFMKSMQSVLYKMKYKFWAWFSLAIKISYFAKYFLILNLKAEIITATGKHLLVFPTNFTEVEAQHQIIIAYVTGF